MAYKWFRTIFLSILWPPFMLSLAGMSWLHPLSHGSLEIENELNIQHISYAPADSAYSIGMAPLNPVWCDLSQRRSDTNDSISATARPRSPACRKPRSDSLRSESPSMASPARSRLGYPQPGNHFSTGRPGLRAPDKLPARKTLGSSSHDDFLAIEKSTRHLKKVFEPGGNPGETVNICGVA